MAYYNVDAGGNAPSNAKSGDYIVTAGGTYQVMDASKYQGMTSDQLKSAGVGYNPSSGLYSKKVNNTTSNDATMLSTSSLDDWLKSSNAASQAKINSSYNTNVANAKKSYNEDVAGQKTQAEQVKNDYLQAMMEAQNDAYYNSVAAVQGAGSRGIANSQQAQAAANSALYAGAQTKNDTILDRNEKLNEIYTNINTLAQNYNVTLDELEKNKLADELSSMNENQLNYLAKVMEIETANNETFNTANQNRLTRDFEASESQKTRDFEASESQKAREYEAQQAALDRQAQYQLAALSRSSSGGGSYSSGSGSGNSTDYTAQQEAAASLFEMYTKGQTTNPWTEAQYSNLSKMIIEIGLGKYTYDDFVNTVNKYNNAQSTSSGSSKGSSSSSSGGFLNWLYTPTHSYTKKGGSAGKTSSNTNRNR